MKKIMFNDKFGLTEAVLKGKKTMTRCLCKYDRPNENYEIVFPYFEPKETGTDGKIRFRLFREFAWENKEKEYTKWNKAQYRIGEVVAIAQSYKDANVRYIPEEDEEFGCYNFPADQTKGWNNKMFVRADLMPHQIQITDIFIQKLHDISDEDCLKEGINEATRDFPWYWYEYNNKKFIFNEPRQAFASLIDKVYVNGTCEENLYVFGYEFKLIK